MKAYPLKDIKQELNDLSQVELKELCLRLARFKKENKELLSYLLFSANKESEYIEDVKLYIDEQSELINTKSFFFIKKSMRKILTQIKKHIRYSKKKETEIELLLYFCKKQKAFLPSIRNSTQLQNMHNRQLVLIKKSILTLHEDLQYDYNLMLDEL